MRKILGIICIAAVVTAVGWAQGPGNGQRGGRPDPQTMIDHRVQMLTSRLNLTDAQQTQAKTIFSNALTAAQGIQANLQSNRDALETAVKKNDTASIDTFAATAGTLTGQLIAINSKADAAFYAILTADQQSKYDSMPHGPGGMGGPMGPGGFRPGRGRPPQQ